MSLLFIAHNLSKKIQRGCRICFSIFSLPVRIGVIWKGKNCGTFYQIYYLFYTYVSRWIWVHNDFWDTKNRYRYWILVILRNSFSKVTVFIKLNIRKRKNWTMEFETRALIDFCLSSGPVTRVRYVYIFIEIFEYNIIIILHISFLLFFFSYWCFNTLFIVNKISHKIYCTILYFVFCMDQCEAYFFFLNFHIH